MAGKKSQNKSTKRTGRPPGCLLDRPGYQKRMYRKIVKTGYEKFCWYGICTKQTYIAWKKKHPEWHDQVDRAIAESTADAVLCDPRTRQLAVKKFIDTLKNEKLSIREIMDVLKFLPRYSPLDD